MEPDQKLENTLFEINLVKYLLIKSQCALYLESEIPI